MTGRFIAPSFLGDAKQHIKGIKKLSMPFLHILGDDNTTLLP
jgi:hypothetical protein